MFQKLLEAVLKLYTANQSYRHLGPGEETAIDGTFRDRGIRFEFTITIRRSE